MTLVVLASRSDAAARALVHRWQEFRAVLATPDDLCTPGWRYYPGAIAGSCAVIGRSVVSSADIDGMITLLPAVSEHDLVEIVPSERAYVAAEMTAFLRAWLNELPCRVVNRPSASSLCGPGWPRERWIHAASRAGIPVCTVRRQALVAAGLADAAPAPASMTVSVIGEACFDADFRELSGGLASRARQLARIAAVAYLRASFSVLNSHLVDVECGLDPGDEGLMDALRAYLLDDAAAAE